MKAIILAGGQATRLRPITHDLPKCLLVIGKKTILDFQLDTLKKNGIKDILVVTGFKAEMIRNHIAANHADLNVTFIHNEKYETTRAAYGLWVARAYFNDSLLYLNSDLLCDPLILKRLIECPWPSATAIQRNKWDEEEVNVVVDDAGKITEIGKLIPEGRSWGEFIGATKFSEEFLHDLVRVLDANVIDGNINKFAADAINATINELGQIMYALDVTDHIAIEIDTIQDFENGKLLWEKYENS